MTNETELTTFHNENAVSRISLWANIIGYTFLVFSLVNLFYQFYDLNTKLNGDWSQLSQSFAQSPFGVISFFVIQVFLEPLKGVFYFLVLRGISQLLSLGLDLFYGDVEIVDEEELDEAAA